MSENNVISRTDMATFISAIIVVFGLAAIFVSMLQGNEIPELLRLLVFSAISFLFGTRKASKNNDINQ
jgi:hypothetical protein